MAALQRALREAMASAEGHEAELKATDIAELRYVAHSAQTHREQEQASERREGGRQGWEGWRPRRPGRVGRPGKVGRPRQAPPFGSEEYLGPLLQPRPT